jgi:hypothetical protein
VPAVASETSSKEAKSEALVSAPAVDSSLLLPKGPA